MRQRDLEKLFRDRVQKDRPKVDTDQLWDNIENELPNNRRKRRIAIFWWFGLAGLALIATFIWLWPDGSFAVKSEQTMSYKSTQETEYVETVTADSDIGTAVGAVDPVNETTINQSVKTVSGASESQINSTTVQISPEVAGINTSNYTNKTQTENKNTEIQISFEPASAVTVMTVREQKDVPILPSLPVAPVLNEEHSLSTPVIDKKMYTKIPVAQSSRSSHWIGLFGGPGITDRMLQASGREGKFIKQWRDSLEQPLENWTLGFQYRYQRGKWFAEASIAGQWINEKTSFSSIHDTSYVIDNAIVEQVVENGQVIEERKGSVTVFERTETQMTSYLKLTHISAGLGIGRFWKISPGWSMVTRAGILNSFTSQYRGTLLDTDGRTYDLEKDPDERFRTNGMQWGGYGALELQWNPNSQWAFSGGILARFMPGSITTENESVNQGYQSYSLNLGIYRIF